MHKAGATWRLICILTSNTCHLGTQCCINSVVFLSGLKVVGSNSLAARVCGEIVISQANSCGHGFIYTHATGPLVPALSMFSVLIASHTRPYSLTTYSRHTVDPQIQGIPNLLQKCCEFSYFTYCNAVCKIHGSIHTNINNNIYL